MLTIHTKKSGEISDKELDKARETVKNVDRPDNPINAIFSVVMLREGWDVQNVTVVVGLRPTLRKRIFFPNRLLGAAFGSCSAILPQITPSAWISSGTRNSSTS
jgi:type III restriction enzyme